MRYASQSIRAGLCLMVVLGVCSPGARAQTASSADSEFFEKKIRPVLAEQCYKCHSASAKKFKGGLLLDSREGMLKGGETGAALVAGKPNQSLLIKAIHWTDKDLQMPPKEQLSKEGVADFERGGAAGAGWAGEGAEGAIAKAGCDDSWTHRGC